MSDEGTPLRELLEAPVREVTLLEDRARVVRRGAAKLGPGTTRLRIDDVAPVISDKTLTVRASGEGVRVVDARVVRRAITRADGDGAPPESVAALEQERDRLDAELDARKDKRAVLSAQANAIANVAGLCLRDLATDVSWGRDVGGTWTSRLDDLSERERSLRQEVVDIEADIADLQRERHRLEGRLAAADHPTEREWAGIEIDLVADVAGEHGVAVDYLVPGACWRPYHTAELIGGAVRWSTDACVWQHTGEDWRDVELRFSTERPSLGIDPPELASDVLAARKKSDDIVVAVREQEIDTVSVDGAVGAGPPELPGIDDGGEALSLRAATQAAVPSDGKPYRVPLSSFEANAETQLVAMPELSACVLLKSIQSNTGTDPILAGPVDLIRDHGMVGRTSVLFVSPGERFELGWGPDAELRLKRVVDSTTEKSRMLSSWITRKHVTEVHLSNIGASDRTIEVTERLPVSEIEKVKVEQDRGDTTDKVAADDNGFVRWTVELPAFGRTTLELAYTVKKHEDVRGI